MSHVSIYHPQTGIVSLDLDPAALYNIGLGYDGLTHRVTGDMDPDDTTLPEIARQAIEAGADVWADSPEDIQWWREYVDGYNATSEEIKEIMEQYRDLDSDQQREVNAALNSMDPDLYIWDASGQSDHETERSLAIGAINDVRKEIARVRGGED